MTFWQDFTSRPVLSAIHHVLDSLAGLKMEMNSMYALVNHGEFSSFPVHAD